MSESNTLWSLIAIFTIIKSINGTNLCTESNLVGTPESGHYIFYSDLSGLTAQEAASNSRPALQAQKIPSSQSQLAWYCLLVTLHCLWCLTQLLSTALLHTIFELHSQRTVGAIACIHLVGRLEWTKFLSKSTFTTQILLEFRKITIFKSSCLSYTCLTIVTLAWTMMIAKVCLRGGSRQSTSVPRVTWAKLVLGHAFIQSLCPLISCVQYSC